MKKQIVLSISLVMLAISGDVVAKFQYSTQPAPAPTSTVVTGGDQDKNPVSVADAAQGLDAETAAQAIADVLLPPGTTITSKTPASGTHSYNNAVRCLKNLPTNAPVSSNKSHKLGRLSK